MNPDLSNSNTDWGSLMEQFSSKEIAQISVQTMVILLLLSGMIFGFFYISRKFVIPYLNSRKAIKKLTYTFFRLEVLAWALFSIFAMYNLLSESLMVSGFIILAVGLLGFNYWRDLFMGLVFRIEENFKKGDSVQYKEHKGVIYLIAKRNIEIKTENEELIFIPYREISKDLLIKRQAKGKLKTAKVILALNGKSLQDISVKIQELLFQCPWAIVLEKAIVSEVENNQISLSVYAVDFESIEKIESFLRARL